MESVPKPVPSLSLGHRPHGIDVDTELCRSCWVSLADDSMEGTPFQAFWNFVQVIAATDTLLEQACFGERRSRIGRRLENKAETRIIRISCATGC